MIRHRNAKERSANVKDTQPPDGMTQYENALRLYEKGRQKEAIEWWRTLAEDFADTEGGRKSAEKLAALASAADDSQGRGEDRAQSPDASAGTPESPDTEQPPQAQ